MERRKLAESFFSQLDEIEDDDDKLKLAEKTFNDVIDRFWMTNYIVRTDDGITHCGLCGNNGVIHSKCFTPRGNKIDQKFFCICPNGQALKKLRRDPTQCYCPTEKDFKKES